MKRTIIITGAAGGIGSELSKHLAVVGWKVGMIDKNPKVVEIAKEVEGEAIGVVCDIRESSQIEMAIESIEKELGTIDALVRN